MGILSHQQQFHSAKSVPIRLCAKNTATHALGGVNLCTSLKFNESTVLLRSPLQYRVEIKKCETICQLTERFLRIIKDIIPKFERRGGNLAELFGAKL